MLKSIHPKLPMRDKASTRDFYINRLGFKDIGAIDYSDYLMVSKDEIELHFFLFTELDPLENYGQVYIRVSNIEGLFEDAKKNDLRFSGGGKLISQPWGQKEFSVIDPDHNLLTFGESS